MTPEGWQRRRAGDFASRSKTVNVSGADLPPLSITKGKGVVLQSDKYSKRIATDSRKYIIARRGQFAFDPMSLYYGAIGYIPAPDTGLVSPDYVVFDVDRSVDKAFLNYLLRSPQQVAKYEAVAETGNTFGKRRRVYWSVFEELSFSLPPIGEQKKIAAILLSIENAIESSQAVIDQLGVVKKALMVELFTRGLPGRHARFKMTEIGAVPEAWEVRSIGELASGAKFSCVGGPFGSDLTSAFYESSGVPVIRGANLNAGGPWLKEEGFVFVSEDKADELRRNLAYPGDIVFTQRGTLGQVAMIRPNSTWQRFVISKTRLGVAPLRRRQAVGFSRLEGINAGRQLLLPSRRAEGAAGTRSPDHERSENQSDRVC